MNVPEGVAKMFCQAESDAPPMSPGPGQTGENSTTSPNDHTVDLMTNTTADFSAGRVTNYATRDPSGRLPLDELLVLAKIRRNRRLGFLPMLNECDFLLRLVDRLLE